MNNLKKLPTRIVAHLDEPELFCVIVDIDLPIRLRRGDLFQFGKQANIEDEQIDVFARYVLSREEEIKDTLIGKFLGRDLDHSWAFMGKIEQALRYARWTVAYTTITPDRVIADVTFKDIYFDTGK